MSDQFWNADSGPTWGAPPQPPAEPMPSPAPLPEATTPQMHFPPVFEGAPPMPRTGRGKARPEFIVCAGAIVAALIAGLVYWLAPSSSSAAPDREPFYMALSDLSDASMLHYNNQLGGGAITLDLRVARNGDAIGSVGFEGENISILTVGGNTYMKLPDDAIAGAIGGSAMTKTFEGRWITGNGEGAFSSLFSSTVKAMSPLVTAYGLGAAVDNPATVFPTSAQPTSTINGTGAIEAKTPNGDLYVSAAAPHRVLRFTPKTAVGTTSVPSRLPSGLPTDMPTGLSSFSGLPTDLRMLLRAYEADTTVKGVVAPYVVDDGAGSAPAADDEAGSFDVDPMTQSDDATAYQQMAGEAPQVANAINTGVQYSLNGDAQISCSTAGCEVTANVTGQATSSNPNSQVTGGIADTEMTADVTVGGEPAGDCTADKPMPISGGSISCDDPEAGAVLAEQQNQAEQEGESGEISIDCEAEAEVVATATVNVATLVREINDEAAGAGNPKNLTLPGNVWSESDRDRGLAVEDALGGNLPTNFPTIDEFAEPGIANSIKTVDTAAPTYQVPSNLKSTLSKYLKTVADYNGQPIPWGGVTVGPNDILVRALTIGYNANSVTPAQMDVLEQIQEAGSLLGVIVTIVGIL